MALDLAEHYRVDPFRYLDMPSTQLANLHEIVADYLRERRESREQES